MRCPSCGRQNPEDLTSCGTCGARLEPVPPASEVRKTVTVVFSDVVGSTSLGEQLDPEAHRKVMSRYFDAMREVLEHHGGTVEKFIGDAVMAVFGVPAVHEDDALRAVRAAAQMRGALVHLNEELEREHAVTIANRTGVNTGEVVAGTGDQAIVTGDAVNTAARLEQAAAPGEIWLGEATYLLVRDAVIVEELAPVSAKGKAEPLGAWRLLEVKPGAEAIAHRYVPIVGRERELGQLRQALHRSVTERTSVLLTLIGAPGVGKTRLVQEFLTDADAEVLHGRCLSYGEGITFWPVVEMLSHAAGVSDLDDPERARDKLLRLVSNDEDGELVADRLAQLFGAAAAPADAQETFWAVRRVFETLATDRALVVDLDDLQWAEPALIDLVEYLAAWIRDAPVLVLCSGRPDLLDARPTWGAQIPGSISLGLEPLSPDESVRLAGEFVQGLPAHVSERIAAVAEGVPLFVEHLAAMLLDDGTLVRGDGGWAVHGDLSSLALPPSVSAVLQARLERLPPAELALLERASVEGNDFHRGAVAALTPEPDRDQVSAGLLSLLRRELIRPARSLFTGDDGYTFAHLTIRDAAYERVPKEARAELHERYGAWLDAAGGRKAEFDEIVGYHLERASRLLGELAPGDERARQLGERAATRLGAAGHRAFERRDIRAAASLLSRADALLPPASRERFEILLDLGMAHSYQGRYEEALGETGTLEHLAREADDVGTAARAVVRREWVRGVFEAAETSLAEQLTEVEAFLPELEALGDDKAIAEVCFFLGAYSTWLGRYSRAPGFLERARVLGARSGVSWAAADAIVFLVAAMHWGVTPAATAIERWRELSTSLRPSRGAWARAAQHVAALLAMTGDVKGARALWQEVRQVLEDSGMEHYVYGTMALGGEIEMLAGDHEAARVILEEGDRGFERLGEEGARASGLYLLADALQALGHPEEAIEAAERAADLASVDDFEVNAQWRSARARVLADLGPFEEAECLSREALQILADTEEFDWRSRSWSSLAYVLASAGRTEEALETYGHALEMYERKGNVVSATRVRRTIAILRGVDPGPAELPPGAWGTTWPLGG